MNHRMNSQKKNGRRRAIKSRSKEFAVQCPHSADRYFLDGNVSSPIFSTIISGRRFLNDSISMILFRWSYGAGVIVNDAPAFGEALPDQREHTADVATAGFFASQVPVAQNQRAVVAGEMKFEFREIEVAHRGAVRIAPFVPRVNGVVSALCTAGA